MIGCSPSPAAGQPVEIGPNNQRHERLHEEFKRRIKTQTVQPSAKTAAMPFWSLLASSQIAMRKVDGWQSLGEPPSSLPLDLAARPQHRAATGNAVHSNFHIIRER